MSPQKQCNSPLGRSTVVYCIGSHQNKVLVSLNENLVPVTLSETADQWACFSRETEKPFWKCFSPEVAAIWQGEWICL